ncbi:hypothetical protein KBY58_02850 [Cyanobium sp. HWJ4-Hawea]|uniref:hypothetical protein n=1 Tax=Cyanobium sp. HWJ4-Hawea TaxID=2823713 RepID=UPI0020CD6F03|nr:hypothetical protein [Cyanobium sp. HWJ4-Hawea]MCP9808370.1 hypothetical protein [Cyanobium sp. HWJ4-Hawea]
MARLAAKPWEQQLRQLVKSTHGRGWSLGPHRGGRTQITRRWSDGTRSSATLPTPWSPSSGPALLALVERVALAMAEQQIGLAPAIALVDAAGAGQSAAAMRDGAVDWPEAAERWRAQQISSGTVKPFTWSRHHKRHVAETLEVLLRKHRQPRDGEAVLEALLEAHPTAPGCNGRRERLGTAARFLRFAVEHCAAPRRYLPPAKLTDLVGRRLDRPEAGAPLLDHQLLRLYRATPDPKWRLAVGLAGTFGLRPVEIGLCSPDGQGGLRVLGVKRNAAGKSADRPVQPLDPAGAAGLGAELLALLAERGADALPVPTVGTPMSTRLGAYLEDRVPAWGEIRREAAETGQGHLIPYSLRHSYAWRGSQLHGLSPRVLAKLMGHTVAVHLKHYGAWASDLEVAQAVAAAAARLQQAHALAG